MILRDALRPFFLPLRRLGGRVRMAFGRVSSARPLSPNFGYDRGTPIDRYYIETFLEDHSGDVRGCVLEIGDDIYSRRFGAAKVTRQDVLNLRAGHPKTTIEGDLTKPGVLPAESFDCIIVIQTLQLIFDLELAVEQLHEALRPGGVLLVTVPGISPIDRGEWKDSWCWSLTPQSMRALLGQYFSKDAITVRSFGNLFSATAFLHGAAIEEVGRRRLEPLDEAYPVTVAARAVR